MVLFLPRDTASVPVCRQILDGSLRTLGVTPDTRTDIALALSEACANVVTHAGPGDEYEVMARTTDGRCIIEVVNTGSTASLKVPDGDPVPVTAEHGRGLRIIDAVVDDLKFSGDGDDRTAVHFEKILDWMPGAVGEQLISSRD